MRLPYASIAGTDVGRRGRNEDAFKADDTAGIYLVADGMGRHACGDVASRVAVEAMHAKLMELLALFTPLGRMDSPGARQAAMSAMARAMTSTCEAVYTEAKSDPTRRDMGTTLDALVVCGRLVVVGHVGDGRVYLLRDGQLHQLTEDHTLVHDQLKAGTITPEEAAQSPFRHVLSRALGIQAAVEPDALVVECVPGDTLIVCTDGLYGPLARGVMEAAVGARPDAGSARRLIDLALAHGSQDNVTGIVLSFAPAAKTAEDTLSTSKVDALRKVPLFEHFDYREKQEILALGNMTSVKQGEWLVKEGDRTTDLYVVVRGRVAVEALGAKITELGLGAHFGEMGLVDDSPRSATVRALEDTVALRFEREAIFALMRKSPDLGMKFTWALVQALSARLRSANENIALSRTSGGFRVPSSLLGPR